MRTVIESAPPLMMGDKLTRAEFLRRWEEQPEIKRAELIGGIVYMPSPLSFAHAEMEAILGGLLMVYASQTPGVKSGHNATTLMEDDSPQPDLYLRILPEYGGAARPKGKYLGGAPELIAEVCASSSAYDLHQKRSLYEQAGVQEYVAVLLYEQEIRWHRLGKKGYRLLPSAAKDIWKSKEFPGLWLDGRAIFAQESAQALATLQLGLQSTEHQHFVQKLHAKK